jgi:ATP-binding cassette subfamily B protein
LVLVFAAITATCQWWMRWLIIGFSRHVERTMRTELFEHVLRAQLSSVRNLRNGEVLARLTAAPEAVRMGYGPGLMHATGTATLAVAAVTFMAITSWQLTLLAILPMATLFVLLRPILKRIHTLSLKQQDALAALAAEAQETFSGVRVVKTFGREDARACAFEQRSLDLQSVSLALVRERALFSGCIEAMAGLALILVFAMGGRAVSAGELGLGSFTAFAGYMNLLVWPMIALGWTLGLFQSADASLVLVNQLRSLPAEPQGETLARELAPSLEVRNLSWTPSGGTDQVLKDISFEIPAGAQVGLVGRLGSGKSALLRLILRLDDPPRGTVFLDGVDVLDLHPVQLRQHIAPVLQDGFLFSASIRDNICFGADVSEARLEQAIADAALSPDIERMPDGLGTEVGERGITLSGGQRQRVALARALLRQAPLLLLDDPLSAVDAETEATIAARMQARGRKQTLLMATHRFHALENFDHILVLDQGRLVQQGPPQELMRNAGPYRRLWTACEDTAALESLP